ncbi:uncharacterized protein BJ171DRAFT_154200 [Polychytrium aggregatum]|uniref:uncharacterized protein n=1 Tax=Polychytrium aggregatum TaxID=110093 RepID=UPI0022FEE7B4|nr:uncharacterized protein BJ171DRAFT_154200 [Polychytrium aggregatum]KAI9203169.1 hypothetical protein BJ171DRAFT_154200 [Polychytrium aggregatum]
MQNKAPLIVSSPLPSSPFLPSALRQTACFSFYYDSIHLKPPPTPWIFVSHARTARRIPISIRYGPVEKAGSVSPFRSAPSAPLPSVSHVCPAIFLLFHLALCHQNRFETVACALCFIQLQWRDMSAPFGWMIRSGLRESPVSQQPSASARGYRPLMESNFPLLFLMVRISCMRVHSHALAPHNNHALHEGDICFGSEGTQVL